MNNLPQIQSKPTPQLYEKRPGGPVPEFLLTETAGRLLLEDGSFILLQTSP